ncbi:hypothetical protein A5653_23305 [Mycobacterium colombiense]|uniref:mycothiol-dependent nitroreductase Rv2466c family protein n=1 Tax=Mycobacterium colombiense TaxID=339268 RepID=UPI0007EEFC27|nr:hypothetical protein [Mycobacterium colombiense]OBK64277.1 hypothetical protein A5653_23305 [Mycobacterium colombiense]
MTSIELYVDPICPFAWVTSRWLADAATNTGRSIAVRQMSLAVLNEDRELAPAQQAKLDWSRRVGRVFAAATAEGGSDAFGQLYQAWGPLVHNDAVDVTDGLLKVALVEARRSPVLLDALDDPARDAVVRAAHQRSQRAPGGPGGSPIIVVDGRGFVGPVLTNVPPRYAGTALLDAVLTAAATPEFAVLQRPRKDMASPSSAENH